MLDGQGCLLPVRHFHRAELCSELCSSGLDKTCLAESSAESSPNPSPCHHLHDSRSDVACACSLDASESNNRSELVNPSSAKSAACYFSPVSRAIAKSAQTCDSYGDLAEEIAVPSIFSELDCSSTGHSGSFSAAQEVDTGAWSIHGELDEVGTSPCIFERRLVGYGRSVQAELRSNRIASVDVVDVNLIEAATSSTGEDEGVGRCGQEESSYKTDKSRGLFKWEFEEISEVKDCSKQVFPATSTNLPDVGCKKSVDDAHLVSTKTSFKDFKEAEESSPQSAYTEEITLKEDVPVPESSVSHSACPVYACATGCKRMQMTVTHVRFGGCTHWKLPDDAHNINTDHQPQPQQQQPYLPGLDNETALRCFAFVSVSDLGRLAMLGRQYRDLVRSGVIFNLRRFYGTVEHLVFIFTSRARVWTAYDVSRNLWKTLPPANVNPAFIHSDKESLSAGTHVLWLGKEMFEFVYYRYDLITNCWQRGPSMVNPRCLFASASCGEFAYVGGGFGPANDNGALSLLNSAERYNSVTGEWEGLPPMSTPRHKCSGFFMDGKFYVIGGRDANHQPIMSGEEYDPVTRSWRTIPSMYFAPEVARRDTFEPSPPLVAVVNNQLFAVENSTNTLKMYNKHNNTWRNLGYLPVRADLRNGWGIAFKGLGDRLFVMGNFEGIVACCWQPGPNPTVPVWDLLCQRENREGSLLYNCAVMSC